MEYVPNVLPIITSTPKAFAAKSNPNVEYSTDMLESAKDVIKAIKSLMAHVWLLILQMGRIRVAEPGTMEFVLNAQWDGILDLTTFVNRSTIIVEHGIQQVFVKNAIMDMLIKTTLVWEILTSFLLLMTVFALNGKTEFAWNALKEHISMEMEFVD